VLFDAVALLPSAEGVAQIEGLPAVRDFIADAFAHHKFIAHSAEAEALLSSADVTRDDGFVLLQQPKDCEAFVQRCRALRYWERGA
jgi:catalase